MAKHWAKFGEFCRGEGRAIVGDRGSATWQKKTQEWLIYLIEFKESEFQQPGGLCGTDLGPLYICDSCVTWSIYRTLAVKTGIVPGALAGSWSIILPRLNADT